MRTRGFWLLLLLAAALAVGVGSLPAVRTLGSAPAAPAARPPATVPSNPLPVHPPGPEITPAACAAALAAAAPAANGSQPLELTLDACKQGASGLPGAAGASTPTASAGLPAVQSRPTPDPRSGQAPFSLTPAPHTGAAAATAPPTPHASATPANSTPTPGP